MTAVRRGALAGVVALGWLSTVSCASESEPLQATPPVFVDAASDTASDSDAAAPLTLCNLAAPSCPDPRAPKCTVVDTPAGYVASCVPESGTRAVGDPCQRQALGHDECAIGLLCTTVAVPVDTGSELVCRKLCITPEECSAPERCYRFSLAQPEIYGMCVPACQPLDTDCGAGNHCIFVLDAARSIFGMCDTHGTVPEGGACNQPQQCERGMACVTDRGCRQYCDATRPCTTAGRACTDLGILAFPGLGVCLPT